MPKPPIVVVYSNSTGSPNRSPNRSPGLLPTSPISTVRKFYSSSSTSSNSSSPDSGPLKPGVTHMDMDSRKSRILFIGGTMVDYLSTFTSDPVLGDCSDAKAKVVIGGVALNSARILVGLGNDNVSMACVLGEEDDEPDSLGALVLKELRRIKIKPAITITERGQQTASFTGLHTKDGEVYVAAASKRIYQDFDAKKLVPHQDTLLEHQTWILDSSYSAPVYEYLANVALDQVIFLTICGAYEASNFMPILPKARALFGNKDEMLTLASKMVSKEKLDTKINDIQVALTIIARTGVTTIFATDGENGLHVLDSYKYSHWPAPKADVVCVNGAGDALMAAATDALINGQDLATAIANGQNAAKCQIEGRAKEIKRTYESAATPTTHTMPVLAI